MSKRTQIVNALVTKIKGINGVSPYLSNLFTNVEAKLVFWDEVKDYPFVFVTSGQESREYLPGGFKWGNLVVTIRIYVKSENSFSELESIFADLERIIDSNGHLEYSAGNTTEDVRILSINTDEGLLAPIGVGEMTLLIMYDLETAV